MHIERKDDLTRRENSGLPQGPALRLQSRSSGSKNERRGLADANGSRKKVLPERHRLEAQRVVHGLWLRLSRWVPVLVASQYVPEDVRRHPRMNQMSRRVSRNFARVVAEKRARLTG